ncbi:putative RNA-directed DNA polymerase, eukaryota, reverse transcriptase zinc-binding domain protein [Tanacetum coccineum]
MDCSTHSALMAVKFKKKLQQLKISIKSWITLCNSLEALDLKAETIPLSPNEATARINIIKDLTALERLKILDLHQKAKVRWATDGDENSRFFHGMINSNSNRVRINGLNISGSWITDPVTIKEHIFQSFESKYKEGNISRPSFSSNLFKQLSLAESNILDQPFSFQEIKDAVWDCGGLKWRKWISSCLNSAFASVLINGSPTKEFKVEKGLRQGDPLSHFLFILAIETLNVALLQARNNNIFHRVKVGKDNIYISHIQFLDDALIMGEWSFLNAMNLSRILTCFHLASGLKVNYNKSKLYGIGVSRLELNSLASTIGCLPSQFPCTYLGLSIGAKMSRCANWKKLIEKFQMRLSSWKSKTLSFGGRLTLVKSILGSLGVYYFSTFKAPSKVINTLEGIRRNFFWGGSMDEKRISWIAWDKAISPISKGGLVIRSIHGTNGDLHDIQSIKSKSGPWFRIAKIKDDLLKVNINLPSIFKKKIGNGCNTLFWHDNWLGGSNLKATFPRLFHLETNPSCLVRDRTPSYIPLNITTAPLTTFASPITPGSPLNTSLVFNWAWNRPIRSEEELNELSGLCNLVAHLRLTLHEDRWECTVIGSRVFMVKGLRGHIIAMSNNTFSNPTRWNKILPLKINIFSWRTSNTRLPTRVNLDIRGVDLHTIRCPICEDALESEEHLFVYSLPKGSLFQQRAEFFLTPSSKLPFGIYGDSETKWSST